MSGPAPGRPEESPGGAPRIGSAEVAHVARLARLELSPEEQAWMPGQLGAILDYVAALARADTEDVEPTSHVLPLVNVLRDDEVRPSWSVEAMLANAPEVAGDLVRVPRILQDPA